MNGFEVDPDALKASAAVATRQDDRLDRIDSYIASACSDFGAFSSVLNLFQGSYESAVATARDGMSDSRKVAVKVRDAFSDSAQDYLDTDREAYEWFKAKFGDLVNFPPYDPPGSGEDVPGGPTRTPPERRRRATRTAPSRCPRRRGGSTGRSTSSPATTTPSSRRGRGPTTRCATSARTGGVVTTVTSTTTTARSATTTTGLELARADRPDAQTQADSRSYEHLQQRASDAYDRAYTDAINDGATDAEAREAGRDAGNQQFSDDSADRTRRNDVSDTAGTTTTSTTRPAT